MCQLFIGRSSVFTNWNKKDVAFACILGCKHIVYAEENGLFVFVKVDVAVKILRVTAEKKGNLEP